MKNQLGNIRHLKGGAEMSIAQENFEQSKLPISKSDIEQLYEMARALKYGSITLVFQDGKLIQIEKNEKVRVK
jgi:hypothetical protein